MPVEDIQLLRNPAVRAVFLVCTVILGGTNAIAQVPQPSSSPKPTLVSENDAEAWKEFSSKKGRFVILFPGAPRESTQSIPGPGITFELRIVSLTTFAEYSVMYADYPDAVNDEDPAIAERVLDQGLEGAVAEVHSELIGVVDVSIDGHPGRSYKERMPSGSILRGKTFLVGHRLYQIAITTPKEQDVPAETIRFYEATAKKFLDSFRLINAATLEKIP